MKAQSRLAHNKGSKLNSFIEFSPTPRKVRRYVRKSGRIENLVLPTIFLLTVAISASLHFNRLNQSLNNNEFTVQAQEGGVSATAQETGQTASPSASFSPSFEQVVESKKPESSMAANTRDCIRAYPEIAEKLKAAFPDEQSYILDLVCRESSYRKTAINPSSGACGLFQALPCKKMKCELTDADCQIAWGKKYISERYGSVKEAVKFHNLNNWY